MDAKLSTAPMTIQTNTQTSFLFLPTSQSHSPPNPQTRNLPILRLLFPQPTTPKPKSPTLLVLKHYLIGGAACGGIAAGAFTFVCPHSNIVDTIPIPTVWTGMYCTGTYIGIETPTFHTGLNKYRPYQP